MKKFFVCCKIESRINGIPPEPPFTEKSVRYVLAEDEFEARRKAEAFCKDSEHSYRNGAGELVSWHFVEFEHLREFREQNFDDGVEVYSRFNQRPELPEDIEA